MMRRRLLALLLVVSLLAQFVSAAYTDASSSRWSSWHRAYITGYDLTGLTATGVLTRPGVCAVDPYTIPLHAAVQIKHVGSCVALDTGSAVIGWHVDVWVPTEDDASAITGTQLVRYHR